MRRKPLNNLSIFELTVEYERAASQFLQALKAHYFKTANKQNDLLVQLVEELKQRGAEGRAALISLLRSNDWRVRIHAAGTVLRFAPEQAKAVLKELAADPDEAIRREAESTLEEWRKGLIHRGDWPIAGLSSRSSVNRSRRRPLESLSISELIAEYQTAASLYGEAVEGCSARITNKQHDFLRRLDDELKQRRAEGRAVILGLMKSSDRGIRFWAAGTALHFAPEQAEPVLEALADGKGTLSFNASVLLEEWRKGNVKREDWPP